MGDSTDLPWKYRAWWSRCLASRCRRDGGERSGLGTWEEIHEMNFYLSPVSIVMDQTRVDPLLLDDELDLVVQARLVRGGEGEEGHADVDLRGGEWKIRQ